MPVPARSYVATGLALMGAGVVGAGQIAPPLQKSEQRIVEAAVSLVAAVGNGQACSGYNTDGCDIWATPTYTPVAPDPSGSAVNILPNLFNAITSVPRAWVDGLNELSYALEVTGNWWVYTPTNVLGFDPADPPKITALVDQVIPFKPLSHAIGDQLAWWARANLPMNDSCTGSVGPACSDIAPIFNVMFTAPIWTLASGYQFPELYNPVSDAEGDLGDIIPGSVGEKAPWSDAYVKLDVMDPWTAIVNYLQADPSTNAPQPLSLPEIGATLDRFAKALVLAFNPFVPRSYLLKGWPYTALTPLFLPFVPLLCKTCNPDNPGGPPMGWAPSAAAEVAPAQLVSAQETEPAAPAATPAAVSQATDSTGEPPVTGGRKQADTTASDDSVDTTASGDSVDTTASGDSVGTTASGDSVGTTAPDDSVGTTAPDDSVGTTAPDDSVAAVTSQVSTTTPASIASAARAGFPDLAPADVTAPSGAADAPSQSVSKPHRGQAHAASSAAKSDDGGGNATQGRGAEKSGE